MKAPIEFELVLAFDVLTKLADAGSLRQGALLQSLATSYDSRGIATHIQDLSAANLIVTTAVDEGVGLVTHLTPAGTELQKILATDAGYLNADAICRTFEFLQVQTAAALVDTLSHPTTPVLRVSQRPTKTVQSYTLDQLKSE